MKSGRCQPVERFPRVTFDGSVDHPILLELVDQRPELGREIAVVGSREVEPFRNSPHARIEWRLVQGTDLQESAYDGLANAHEIDPRMDQGIVEVKNDDWLHAGGERASGDACGAEPVAGPVCRPQAGDDHTGSFVRGVHELAVADEDAVVAQPGGVRVLEEHQVTRFQLIT